MSGRSRLGTDKVTLSSNITGESAVGKSSLVVRFVNREYAENREPTIGGEY